MAFAAFWALSFPWTTLEVEGLVYSLIASALFAVGVAATFTRHMYLSTSLLAAYALAYSVGLGDATAVGLTRINLAASPGAVVDVLLVFAAFLAGTLIVARVAQLELGRRWRPLPPAADRATDIAVLAFFVVVFVSALAAGRITYWGVEVTGERGGLEHWYPAMLFLLVASQGLQWIDSRAELSFVRKVGVVALGLLVFILQSRRIMVECALLLTILWLAHRRLQRASARSFKPLLAIAAVALLMLLGSSGWRSSGDSTDLFERMENTFTVDDSVREDFSARLTYLWFDALARDFAETVTLDIAPDDLIMSAVARAVPRVLMPGKDDVPIVACETPFIELGFDEDLPCTPHTEAWLAWGAAGIVIVALMWGLVLGLCEVLVRRPGLGRVFALLLFFPFTELETGAFPMVQGLRLAIVGVVAIGGVALILQWSMPARPRGRRPLGRLD